MSPEVILMILIIMRMIMMTMMTMMMMMMMSPGGGSETLWEACGCMVHWCGECLTQHFLLPLFLFCICIFISVCICIIMVHLCGKCPTFPFAFIFVRPIFLQWPSCDHHVVSAQDSLLPFFLSVKLSYFIFFFHFFFFHLWWSYLIL